MMLIVLNQIVFDFESKFVKLSTCVFMCFYICVCLCVCEILLSGRAEKVLVIGRL